MTRETVVITGDESIMTAMARAWEQCAKRQLIKWPNADGDDDFILKTERETRDIG